MCWNEIGRKLGVDVASGLVPGAAIHSAMMRWVPLAACPPVWTSEDTGSELPVALDPEACSSCGHGVTQDSPLPYARGSFYSRDGTTPRAFT